VKRDFGYMINFLSFFTELMMNCFRENVFLITINLLSIGQLQRWIVRLHGQGAILIFYSMLKYLKFFILFPQGVWETILPFFEFFLQHT